MILFFAHIVNRMLNHKHKYPPPKVLEIYWNLYDDNK